MLNEDYKEILYILLKNKVEFFIGAYAMAAHGYPRATGDFDIWVRTDPENSRKIYSSLVEFGAPLAQITSETFIEKGIVFQIGVAPRRIDIITAIDGVEFDKAYREKTAVEVENLNLPFLSKENLIKNKQSTKREKDKLDLKYLTEDPQNQA